ncbi:MAG: hypothetical protein ACREAC_08550, partial [Blastocatellia bacterium]
GLGEKTNTRANRQNGPFGLNAFLLLKRKVLEDVGISGQAEAFARISEKSALMPAPIEYLGVF